MKQIGILHLEDSEPIRMATHRDLEITLDIQGYTSTYIGVDNVLAVNGELTKLRSDCDHVIFIADLNVEGILTGQTAIKTVAKYYEEVLIIVYTSGSDNEVATILNESRSLRTENPLSILSCKKQQGLLAETVKSILGYLEK